jgi:hypothetical protein
VTDQVTLGGKQAFRAWARVHHPDLGGDPEAFAEGLRQWRAAMRRPATGWPAGIGVYRRRRGLAAWLAHWRRRREWLRSLRLH